MPGGSLARPDLPKSWLSGERHHPSSRHPSQQGAVCLLFPSLALSLCPQPTTSNLQAGSQPKTAEHQG